MDQNGGISIGALADRAGVNVETIRFYQRKGLMPQPEKPYGGIRRYGDADLARVGFIKAAQRLGFSLDEVADLLKLEDGTRCGEARQLAEHKLADVRQKLSDFGPAAHRVGAGSTGRSMLRRPRSGQLPADRVPAGERVTELNRYRSCTTLAG